MEVYTNTSMVKQRHIDEIESQLKNLKSALPKNFDKAKDRALSNILFLATGNGKYRISIESVNKISSDEFKIIWK
jgi:hypothetical protein